MGRQSSWGLTNNRYVCGAGVSCVQRVSGFGRVENPAALTRPIVTIFRLQRAVDEVMAALGLRYRRC